MSKRFLMICFLGISVFFSKSASANELVCIKNTNSPAIKFKARVCSSQMCSDWKSYHLTSNTSERIPINLSQGQYVEVQWNGGKKRLNLQIPLTSCANDNSWIFRQPPDRPIILSPESEY